MVICKLKNFDGSDCGAMLSIVNETAVHIALIRLGKL